MQTGKVSPFDDDAATGPVANHTPLGEPELPVSAVPAKKRGRPPAAKFTTPPASKPRWTTMDFSEAASALPDSGTYPGEIVDLKLLDGEHDLRGIVALRVFDAAGVAHDCDDRWLTICAVPPSPRVKELREGADWLRKIGRATGVETAGRDPFELAEDVIGRKVAVVVAKKSSNGVAGLTVRGLLPAID